MTVDGVRKAQPVARFDRYCTYYRVGTLGVFTGADAEHEIEIELDAAQPDRTPVLVQGVKPEELTGTKYTGTEWYAGRLMLVGDVVASKPSPVFAENVLMDAAIETYADWPKDAEKAMGGSWATTAATLADVAAVRASGRLEVNAGEERLALVSEQTVSLGDRVKALVFATDLACDGYDVGLFPSVETDWKGAVLVGVADGVAAYYGLCRVGDRNVWTRLEGATPPTQGSVRLTLTYRRTAEGLTVEYQANGVTLTVENRACQPVVGDNVFKGFVCGGCGTLETMVMSKVPGTGFLIQLCARD